ncbi:MAG: hypothetical protein ACON35_01775 [Candidatus Marinamargulisbacteria bacterium]
MAYEQVTHQLHPLLQRINSSKRIPNAILTYGENSQHLLLQLLHFSEQLNRCKCSIPEDNENDMIEPATDIILIQPTTTIKIETIKLLQERIKYGASSENYCIVIIHNSHKITTSAANALLKSIEEPQKNTLFLFSTTHREQLPKTILSRCHKLFIPENNHAADERQKSRISAIEATLPYTPCQSFLKLPLLDKVIFIQNLPFNQTVTAELITAWQYELATLESQSIQEQKFLKKIIEIIQNIKYNLNLKLQLMAATFVVEEDANGTPR